MSCPFCTLPPERILLSNEHFKVIRDGFPVSLGHTLVIPHRHAGSLFELTEAEFAALWPVLQWVKSNLAADFAPDSVNVGVNDGAEAGQTVPHLHVHVIPRYAGDVPDPRGGVRWILPEKADYWTKP
ncbi:MAG: HIT family protein [Fluviicoccus sp.]|uniref:HIT family protein n=1 Tax=Fluviicoccus sp. TaxID=2003552 RepID=UPI002728C484|nr:HIT family protein [Fluviicoccus sp.]MDO8329578.1 HIT family protein [Fluviicoccus sp.]